MSLRHEVREERERQGRTIADVAREAGVKTEHLSRYERGLRGMSSARLDRVLSALRKNVGAKQETSTGEVVPTSA